MLHFHAVSPSLIAPDLPQIDDAMLQINAIQKRIHLKLGIHVLRQDIKNKLGKIKKAEHEKIWNRTVREQLVVGGYLDPAMKELNSFSRLIVEGAVDPTKPFVALIKAKTGRGYGEKEFVLVSPLGSKEMYSMSESEFDAVVDPGTDGVCCASLACRVNY